MASSLRQVSLASRNSLSSGTWPIRRLLQRGGADRHHAHAADGHGGARDFSGRILDEQRRRRHDGEIAMPPGELDEAMAVALGHTGNRTAVRISFGSIAGVM